MSNRPVVIAGGGIAGIAAALRLAEHGTRVLLLETRTKLGGRATSFRDVRTGETLDNCQHVALACCTNYLDLLRRLDAHHTVQWHREIHWFEPGGRRSVMKPSPLPAPAHFSASFLAMSFLSLPEKTALARAALAILRADRRRHAGTTFRAWLDHHRQPDRVIRRFWEPVIVSACNLSVDRVDAAAALHVFQEGFLASRDASAMGVPAVPLLQLYDRAEPAITGAGGAVRTGVSVAHVAPDRVVTREGETIHADRVVLAVPFERAAELLRDHAPGAAERLDHLRAIPHSPILGVHLAFDRPVMTTPNAVLVEGAVQWLFRKDDQGTRVHAVISAADEWMPLPEQDITERVLADLRGYLPRAEGARLISSRPVKEKRATFACTPEFQAIRPTPDSGGGVVLAGDYVDTGWPATMEGATRAGYLAAASVLGTDPHAALAPPLAEAAIPRLLARAPLTAAARTSTASRPGNTRPVAPPHAGSTA